jgi:peroxiredoxin
LTRFFEESIVITPWERPDHKEVFMYSGAVLPAILALEAVILLTLWVFLYQLMKQQGRLLLRLDGLQRQVTDSQIAALTGSNAAAAAAPTGLSPGTAVTPFSLPDLAGQTVALESFKGKRVLLVHWSPGCGYCAKIAPALAELLPELEKHQVQLLFVSYGDAESNRKLAEQHGLRCPILLVQEGSKTPEMFQQFGTPVAYLLDEQGLVLAPIAIGADQVPALAKEAALGRPPKRLAGTRAFEDSQIERNGLKAGTPAPSFTLPDLDGREVSLEDYRGRQVLLVFSDPDCGPCNQVAPELARLHRQHRDNGLALIMVGRGELEENRRKAQEHGLEFPVVLQKKWELSRQYGIFATPVAFLVGEDGVIQKNVAMGSDAILEMARTVALPENAGVR